MTSDERSKSNDSQSKNNIIKNKSIIAFLNFLQRKWVVLGFRLFLLATYVTCIFFGFDNVSNTILGVIFAHFVKTSIPKNLSKNMKAIFNIFSAIILLVGAYLTNYQLIGIAVGLAPFFNSDKTKKPINYK